MIQFTGQTKEDYRLQIITELAEDRLFEERVNYLGFINSVHKDSFINEDVKQGALVWICKMKTDKLIEVYEKSPLDLLRLAVHIAWRSGYCKPSKGAENFNPSHSLKWYILHNSSFNQITQVSTTEEFDTENTNQLVVYDGAIIDTTSYSIPEHSLVQCLDTREQNIIEAVYYSPKKRRGKRSRFLKAELEYIKEKLSILFNLSNPSKGFKISIDDKLKLVLTYPQWIDYNIIWDEELLVADKMKLMKISETGYYYRRNKILEKIEVMRITINNIIKRLDEN